ncbi:unnamed protein product, partial [Timema podura]|nr:unnamed protein product [Timema podura]
MASLVLTDSSQLTADGFEKLPDQNISQLRAVSQHQRSHGATVYTMTSGHKVKDEMLTRLNYQLCGGIGIIQARRCVGRDYGASSIVCVCNATYCDSLEPINEERISGGNYLNYVSSKSGLRLEPNTGTLSDE